MSKNTLLVIIFFVLFLPYLQQNLSIFDIKDLNGSQESTGKISFTISNWFSGVFQVNQDSYLRENFGLRNTFVRLCNQYRFWFYRMNSNREVVFCKSDELIAQDYIDCFNGKDFKGVDTIVRKSLLVKELQELMKKKGIYFFPVFAPNKARVLSTLIPDRMYKKGYSNYEGFAQCFSLLKVDYIDFNSLFCKMNSVSQYPLYSKYGIHWSTYGRTLAADSIIKFINYKTGINTPQMDWKKNITESDSLRYDDYDIGKSLNLFTHQLPSEKLAYPTINYVNTQNTKPSLLVVGDSYNFGIEQTDMPGRVFSDYKFFYYFTELRPYNPDPAAFYKLDLAKEFNDHKVILLICTEQNLRKLGWGFLEKAVDVMKGKTDPEEALRNKIKIMEFKIQGNEAWMQDLRRNAILFDQDLASIIHQNAKFMIEEEMKNEAKSAPKTKEDWINAIRGSKDWMEQIKKKAEERKIPVDSMVVLDAEYVMSQQK